MSRDEIKENIITLNLKNFDKPIVKIIYIFPRKVNRNTISCVIEVTLDIRTFLLRDKMIYINYYACGILNYVRILQCYKCLAFGHFAKHCRFAPLCGHYAGEHELKDCTRKIETYGNYKRWLPQAELQHSALDSKTCLTLRKKITDRISSTNYK